jgi:anti-sigma regulatory factor (Ser/Thr protein kinase)
LYLHRLRFLLAAEPRALTEVLAVVQRGISTFLIRRTGFTVVSGARTGAVTLIQRFGSALNLNPHLHMLFLDGAYRFGSRKARFHRARRATNDDLARLLDTLSQRIVGVLERRGLLVADPVDPYLEFEVGSSLDQIQAASVQYRIAVGPHAGRKAITLYSVPPLEAEPTIAMIAQMYGFSLHAGTVCEAHQRGKLERLCRSAALKDIRRSVGALRQPAEPFSISQELAILVGNAGSPQLEVSLQIEGAETNLSHQASITLYRAAQEGLTNIQKHAQARRASLQVQFDDQSASLTIRDDGCGFDPTILDQLKNKGHYGLAGVRERLELIHGSFQLVSRPGVGTMLRITVPKEPSPTMTAIKSEVV